eukprot:UN4018
MVLALNVSVYFCKLLPLHMNGNLPVGIGMHVFAMICDLIRKRCCFCLSLCQRGSAQRETVCRSSTSPFMFIA